MPSVADLVRERFGELSEIQKIAIPRVLNGENVLILAPTGYGKTESALLPVLEKLKDEKEGICALYITPLRALSRDLKERFEWWCNRLDVSHDMRTGDTTQHERTLHRKNPPKILLTTVESLQALLMGRVMRSHLKNVRFVIVDEVHDVLDNKRGAQLSLGLERLNLIASFQRIAISATVSDETEAAKLVFGDRPFAVCEAGKNRNMEIEVLNVENQKEKLDQIKNLVEKNRSLLFVNTRSAAEELGATLKEMGAPIEVHHGSLAKEARLDTEDKFKAGLIRSLLCTSSLELGIDVGDISLVVQYGSPHQVSRLIQRVGRSGHSREKTPRGIVFSNDYDDLLESQVIEIFAKNGFMERKSIERGALDVIAHQVVGLTLDLGKSDLAKIHEILSRSYAYGIDYGKLRKIAIQLYGEGLLYLDHEGEKEFVKATVRARIYYATHLSTIPKTKRYLMREVASNRIVSNLDEEFVVNLDVGSSFLSQGRPYRVLDITETEILTESTFGTDIMVPSWTGEEIPVVFEIAQQVGKMRKIKRLNPMPDDKTVVIELIGDLIVVHACFGTKVNEGLSRMFGKNLSRLVGESVRAVADPYRIFVKLPFPLSKENILREFLNIRNVQVQLEEAISDSSLLRLRFHHVGRLFGLLSDDATINSRFINALRNSVVYEETVRSIFSRYFDVPKTQEIAMLMKTGVIKVVVDERKTSSFFAKVGLDRISGGENMGGFEPREKIIAGFKENVLSKTLELVCLNCGATRFMHLAGAPDKISCHKCGQPSLARSKKSADKSEDQALEAAIIRAYGKKALIALATYGVGPTSADRLLKKLHKDEEGFYLALIEAQKVFVKNKKYWKL
ncbi:DEAD/DEAH box helicase [Candidatus Micrarchaeota archaeon]|nr:DEAD/DEAH box helicase [Candidatus Micrarchaeota archaeon]